MIHDHTKHFIFKQNFFIEYIFTKKHFSNITQSLFVEQQKTFVDQSDFLTIQLQKKFIIQQSSFVKRNSFCEAKFSIDFSRNFRSSIFSKKKKTFIQINTKFAQKQINQNLFMQNFDVLSKIHKQKFHSLEQNFQIKTKFSNKSKFFFSYDFQNWHEFSIEQSINSKNLCFVKQMRTFFHESSIIIQSSNDFTIEQFRFSNQSSKIKTIFFILNLDNRAISFDTFITNEFQKLILEKKHNHCFRHKSILTFDFDFWITIKHDWHKISIATQKYSNEFDDVILQILNWLWNIILKLFIWSWLKLIFVKKMIWFFLMIIIWMIFCWLYVHFWDFNRLILNIFANDICKFSSIHNFCTKICESSFNHIFFTICIKKKFKKKSLHFKIFMIFLLIWSIWKQQWAKYRFDLWTTNNILNIILSNSKISITNNLTFQLQVKMISYDWAITFMKFLCICRII